MDVSPQTLREVEFREKMRGYHPEDVDQFLERVAAGIEVLQERLRQAVDRAARAEQQSSESSGTDETLRRTLVLAQRTADLAVQEAREQAARILANAEQQAQSILGDAEDRARRAQDEAEVDLRAEIGRLEAHRQQLHTDTEGLQRWLDDHRSHLTGVLHDALGRLDQLGLLSEPPVGRGTDRAGGDIGADRIGASEAGAEPDAVVAGHSAPADGAPVTGEVPVVEVAAPAPVAPSDRGDGPATMAWRPADELDLTEGGGGDPFFAQLRQAVADDGPLGPRPVEVSGGGADEGLFDQDSDRGVRSGGRLFRRR